MIRLRGLAGSACLLVLLWGAPSRAAPAQGGTIVLVVDAPAVALATRVAAELEALGFAVRQVTEHGAPTELAARARAAGAFAAISIGASTRGRVEITVLDRVTGKTVRRELIGRSLSDPTTRELVALRAAELLRASLMEVEAPHPARGDLPPSEAVRDVATAPETIRRKTGNLRLGAETGVLLAPGLGAAPLLQLSFRAQLSQRLELAASVGSQLIASERREAAGRMDALARWLSVGPLLLLLPRSEQNRVTLGVDARLALIALSAAGFAADAEHRGRSVFVWAPAATLGIDSRVRLLGQLWWTLSPAVGVAMTELSLRSEGQDVRTWGRPWLQCATGVEVELP